MAVNIAKQGLGLCMSNIEWTLLVTAIAGVLVALAILKLAFEEQAQDRNHNRSRRHS